LRRQELTFDHAPREAPESLLLREPPWSSVLSVLKALLSNREPHATHRFACTRFTGTLETQPA